MSKKSLSHNIKALPVISLVALTAVLLLVCALPASSNLSAESQVQAAWRNANSADSFHFATDLAQTTYPAPALTNVGRSSRTDSMHIEGTFDRPNQTMLMSLWNGGGSVLNAQDALELRVVGDVAEGRVSGGEWEKVDQTTIRFPVKLGKDQEKTVRYTIRYSW